MNLVREFEHNCGPGRGGEGFEGNNFQEFNFPRGGKLNFRIDRLIVRNLFQYLLKFTMIEFRFSKKHQRRLSPINKALLVHRKREMHSLEAMVCPKLSSANLEKPHLTDNILVHSLHAKNWKIS